MRNDPMAIDTSEASGARLAALATSEGDGGFRWAELRVWFLPGQRKCWLAESRGATCVEGERDKVRRLASAKLDRALKLFDDSTLGSMVTEAAHEFAEDEGLPKFPSEGAPDDDRKALAQLFGVQPDEMVSWSVAARALGMGESSLRMAVKNGTDVRVPLRTIFPFIDRAAFQRAHVQAKEQIGG